MTELITTLIVLLIMAAFATQWGWAIACIITAFILFAVIGTVVCLLHALDRFWARFWSWPRKQPEGLVP